MLKELISPSLTILAIGTGLLVSGRPNSRTHAFAWAAGVLAIVACAAQMVRTVAARVIEIRRRERITENRCPECGYSLQGLPGDRCPECGSPTRAIDSPLAWPNWWRKPSQLDLFLVGTPLIGPDWWLHRSIARQLRERTDDMVQAAWGTDVDLRRVQGKVCYILASEMEWPNCRFLPTDPMEIVLFDPSTEMRTVGALMELDRVFSLPEDFIDPVLKLTVGAVVQRILEYETKTGQVTPATG